MNDFGASVVRGAGFAVGGLLATALLLHLAKQNDWQLQPPSTDSDLTYTALGLTSGTSSKSSSSSWGGC